MRRAAQRELGTHGFFRYQACINIDLRYDGSTLVYEIQRIVASQPNISLVLGITCVRLETKNIKKKYHWCARKNKKGKTNKRYCFTVDWLRFLILVGGALSDNNHVATLGDNSAAVAV